MAVVMMDVRVCLEPNHWRRKPIKWDSGSATGATKNPWRWPASGPVRRPCANRRLP